MPRNSEQRMATIITSVIEAFFGSGFLKAGTPSAIASMPVSAVQPAAKARRIKKNESACNSAGK